MRSIFLISMAIGFAICAGLYMVSAPIAIFLALILLALLFVGIMDMMQTKHAIKSNFPVIGHFRYILEAIRPEIQQYFIESNIDGAPINRNKRSLVYQRSKRELESLPFGTQEDVYKQGNEWVCHSMYPGKVADDFDRILVGGKDCKKPYLSSRLNISAMSYGSLSDRAVMALNKGAKEGGFSHNTGEGGISEFHKQGGDLVWQIGTGYFGCRTPEGDFSPEVFAEKAQWENVKMIEIKLSQGAKPGKGGILPGVKVTEEIAEIRGVPVGETVISPPSHKEFDGPQGLLEFVKKLRDLSGGKPVGFKLCVGRKSEFLEIISAMKSTNILPDFITVDGSEGGTGAAPPEFSNAVGMPLKDGLSFVSNSLKEAGLRNEIRILAAGKSLTGFDMIRNFSLGADIVNSARGMMLSLGCIQALRCHSNHCPVGITTSNPSLVKGLDVDYKSQRVASYQIETLKVVKSLLSAMGKTGPGDVELSDVHQRQSGGGYLTYDKIYD